MTDQPHLVVVDASVAVKWFISECEMHIEDAWALLEQHLTGQLTLVGPFLLHMEVLNAVRFRGRTERDLLDIAGTLEGLRVELHAVDGGRLRTALTLAARHGLSLYDAAYAALALELDAELVTADRRVTESGACRVRLLGAS